MFISGSDDKIIKIWSCEKNIKYLKSLVGHTNWIRCVNLSISKKIAVSCGDDKAVKIWDIES